MGEIIGKEPLLTIEVARKILGTSAKGLSDAAVRRLVDQVDLLTDIILKQASGSIKQSSIDVPVELEHTES